jgi:DNA recombination protein RmuC
MQTLLFVLIVIVILGFAVVLYFMTKKTTSGDATAFGLLNQNLQAIQEQMNKSTQHTHSTIQQQFTQTSKIIQDVTERLGKLDATNKQVLDFSSQLQNLQNILKNPKQRGVLGEFWLESLLSTVLTKENYSMQYHLGVDEKSGKELIADAVILVRNLIIPIDAKFSLENYNRMVEEPDKEKRSKLETALKQDVKTRIDETAKYVRPEQGTMNFAFMFIPAEGVYYNLLNAEVGSNINSRNLVEYALDKRVMIVSPTSFFAYLQTVLLGLQELQLEKSTMEIIKRVADLSKHFAAFGEYHDKLGKSLGTVVNQFNLSSGELKKMSKDVGKVTDGAGVPLPEIAIIDKPALTDGQE